MSLELDALAFGPHPDDVEICAAGTLLKMKARGHRVGVVDLTAGEMGTRGSREIRARETAAASELLGLDLRLNLDLGDGRLDAGRGNQLALVRLLRAHRPRVVFAPWGRDDHPDHEAAAELVRRACFLSGMGRVETGQAPHRPPRLLFYPGRREFVPSFVVDIGEHWERRRQAAWCYRSQFHDPESSEPPTAISSPDFWHFIEARAMYYGQLIGVRHGEAFWCEDALPVDDPVAFFDGTTPRGRPS